MVVDSKRFEGWLASARESAALRYEARLWSPVICLRDGRQEVRLTFKDGAPELLSGQAAAGQAPAGAIILEGEPSAWEEVFGGLSLNRAIRELKVSLRGDLREAMKNWRTLWMLFELAH